MAAVVRDAGDGAFLFGHSYGGLVAAGAALRLELPRLALYEPAMGGVLSTADTIGRWEGLIRDGERDTVTREFLREIGGYDDADIGRLERTPLWEARRRIVPTLPRELRAELAHRFDEWPLGELDLPVLLLVGSESPAWAVRVRGGARECDRARRDTRPRGPRARREPDRAGAACRRARPLLRHRIRCLCEP